MEFKTIPLNGQFCPVCGCGLVIEMCYVKVERPGFVSLGGLPTVETRKDYVCPRCRLSFLPNKKTGLVGVNKK